MPDIITVGESMVMMVADQTDPLQYVTSFTRRIAGAESNVAIGLARLDHSVGWVSAVGDDPFGIYIRNTIRGEGVDTSQVAFVNGYPTGMLVKELNEAGDARVFYYRKNSAASRMTIDNLSDNYFQGVKILHITGIFPALSESCRETLYAAIRLAKAQGALVSFDPNLRLQLWSEAEAGAIFRQIVALADIVLPGINEARVITGSADWPVVADYFHSCGNRWVIMKNGPDGAFYSLKNSGGSFTVGYQRGFPVKMVVDTVGAGDGFATGVLSGILEGLPIRECVTRGNAIGAMAVAVRGDVEGCPTRRQLTAFLASTSPGSATREVPENS